MLEVIGTGLTWLWFSGVVFLLCAVCTAFNDGSKESYVVASIKTALVVGMAVSWKQGWNAPAVVMLVVLALMYGFELGYVVFEKLPTRKHGRRQGESRER